MVKDLVVGLSAWIIQDGNYADVTRGDNAAFAIEFYAPRPLTMVTSGSARQPSLERIDGPIHQILGKVIHAADEWWVIDIGIPVYCEDRPSGELRMGDWLAGEIHLGIDPFPYFERLAKEPNAPALIYDWRIDKIEMETAPFIEVTPRNFIRDPDRRGMREISRTNAWEDDSGYGAYNLHCTRLNGSARRTLKQE